MKEFIRKYNLWKWRYFIAVIVTWIIAAILMYIDFKFGMRWFEDNIFVK